MNITALQILTLCLSVIALAACFVPRIPAALIALGGMVCAHFTAAHYPDTAMLIYWGVSTLIILGLRLLQPKALTALSVGLPYVAGGAIIGTVLGFLVKPSPALIILGSAIGAFLGTVAFMRTPKGLKMSPASKEFVDYLAAKGLPVVVASSMSAITIAAVLGV